MRTITGAMLDLNFNGMTAAARRRVLAPYVKERITFTTAVGNVHGTLTLLTQTMVQVDGKGLSLLELLGARVHVGGDWVSSVEHGTAARTTKMNIRLRGDQKEFLERAATTANQTLSDLVLNAALNHAGSILGKSPP